MRRTAYIGFPLKPNGFFTENPANDVPPAAKKTACCHACGVVTIRGSTWTWCSLILPRTKKKQMNANTSQRAAFISAICTEPDDDALRLICADWFEEHGDEAGVARAEFIRLQIERANLSPNDHRQSELQSRELRMLKRWAPIWCGSSFVFKKVLFRRGFIDRVHLHLQHFLHHRRQILSLEPVREICLTGWHRAPTDLIRRVAACEEWKHVQTLRVHHQGPHKSPRSELVLLLESPHLTNLRALHCPYVAFDADARRRFERLPLLRGVSELCFPTLDTLMQRPGNWFDDGGSAQAEKWERLQSLTLPYYLTMDLLRRFTEMPFWNRLTHLELVLPHETRVALEFLRNQVPKSLQELHLSVRISPADVTGIDSFFERLVQSPLHTVHLGSVRLSPRVLEHLLDGSNRLEFRELSLTGCHIVEDHARILAESRGVGALRSLNLAGNWDFRDDAARVLFASDRFRSLTHLNLSETRIGTKGAMALAAATEWDKLRSLDISVNEMGVAGLRTILTSPNLQRLTSLSIAGDQAFDLTPDLATALTSLPNLVRLNLQVHDCDPRALEILARINLLAWPAIDRELEWSIAEHRANRAPDRIPPVDSQ